MPEESQATTGPPAPTGAVNPAAPSAVLTPSGQAGSPPAPGGAVAAAGGLPSRPTYESVFEPQWPGPGPSAPRRAVIGVAVTAIAAAAFLTWDRPTVGWLATAVIATLAIRVAAAKEAPRQDTVNRTIWAVLALALVAVGGLRDATWLWWLCLLTACPCAAMALTGGRAVGAMAQGALAYVFAIFRALPWGARGASAARHSAASTVVRTVAAAAVGLALVVVFGALLASADVAFADVLDDILPTVDAGVIVGWVISGTLGGLATLAACYLALRPPVYDHDAREARRTLRRIEWGLPVGALVVLFGAFVAVQATVLFGGGSHVLRTAGLTYAEYARQGFWQLLAVTALTLVVMTVAARLAARVTVADRVWVRVLLGLLAGLTLVIVASALSRMWAYEQAYGFTELRLLVSAFEAWLGVVFVLFIAAGIRLRGRWVARVALQLAAALLVSIAIANPDQFIATQNIARYQQTQLIDLRYLAGLSPDAAPAFESLPAQWRRCVLKGIASRLEGDGSDTWIQWNYGRQRAREVLAANPDPTPGVACSDVLTGGR